VYVKEQQRMAAINLLHHVQQLGRFVPDNLSEALLAAGYHHERVAAKWLRQQGVPWPEVLAVPAAEHDGYWPWPPEMIKWARSKGCKSPINHGEQYHSDPWDADYYGSDSSDAESDDDDE
jgi:hypothetical protein